MDKGLLARIEFPMESQVHVMRHFSKLEESFSGRLSSTKKRNSLTYLGSKFSSDFVNTPLEIIIQTQKHGRLESFENINYSKIIMRFEFSIIDFPLGIGYDYFLKSDDKQLIEKTWTLHIILHRNRNKWEVTTCFPGELKSR